MSYKDPTHSIHLAYKYSIFEKYLTGTNFMIFMPILNMLVKHKSK